MAKSLHDYLSLLIGNSLQDLRDLQLKIEDGNVTDAKKIVSLAKEINSSNNFSGFIETLSEDGILDQIPDMIRTFDLKMAKKLNLTRLDVMIRTAKPLDQNQVDTIVGAIEKQYKLKALVKTEHDASLIGGIVVKVNDKMIDLSYRTQMSKIQNIVS